MTEHAPPIAFRIGAAAWASALAASLLDGDLTWLEFGRAIVLGVFIWAITYVVVYVAEQYLYESGRMKRPYWMTGEEHPVDEMKRIIKDRGAIVEVPADMGNAYAPIGVTADGKPMTPSASEEVSVLSKLISLAHAIEEGMDKISKRQLESYGVIPDRFSTSGDIIIDYLVSHNLVDDIGNSQYAVTERLKAFLTQTTGVKYDERIRAN